MISSSRQLKDKVRNISDGNSKKATTLIRNFMMERFLERVSISSYRDNFILKGGMLVASIVGVDMRATMDIDTTVKALPLNEADVQRIIEEICNIPLEDNVSFQIKSTRTIMEKIRNGVVILQTSIDGTNWITELVKGNIAGSETDYSENFYETAEIQLVNGCYYRVIVAYEVERNSMISNTCLLKSAIVRKRNLSKYTSFILKIHPRQLLQLEPIPIQRKLLGT